MSFTTAPIAARVSFEGFGTDSIQLSTRTSSRVSDVDSDYQAERPRQNSEGKRKGPGRRTRTLRRMSGFLIETQGEKSKVGLIEIGKVSIYSLPTQVLSANGIRLKNQPFEMDETLKDGALVYEFRAAAEATDAYQTAFVLDEDRRAKRALLLADDAED